MCGTMSVVRQVNRLITRRRCRQAQPRFIVGQSTRMAGVLREFTERLRLKIKGITVPVEPRNGDWSHDAFITLTALMTNSMDERHLIQL